jgi:putative FmdB family regulatory protein
MPLYDFRCRECGAVAEVLVRNVENLDIKCPECGARDLEKLLSASYLVKTGAPSSGETCCGRTERCETPRCATGESCRRH